MTDSLWDQGQAAIAARRALVEAGTPGPWRESGMGTCGCCVYLEPLGDRAPIDDRDADIIVAAVNAFAADTDALAAVLDRHRPINVQDTIWCCGECLGAATTFAGELASTYPCDPARAALTALGVGEG